MDATIAPGPAKRAAATSRLVLRPERICRLASCYVSFGYEKSERQYWFILMPFFLTRGGYRTIMNKKLFTVAALVSSALIAACYQPTFAHEGHDDGSQGQQGQQGDKDQQQDGHKGHHHGKKGQQQGEKGQQDGHKGHDHDKDQQGR